MAGKSLSRLSKSLLDKPQLITLEKFKEISEVLENREYLKDPSLFLDGDTDTSESKSSPLPMIRLEGPTTYKPTGWEAMCGGASYVDMLNQMQSYADQGAKQVVLWIDSQGGQAYRMMSTARKLRKIADENDIHLVGYVDGQCCSAAMGLGSVCHELISHGESAIGSIGVVISLMNNSKQLEKEGLERKFITAGANKVPFDDDGSFREGFLEDLQNDVDDLYEKFVTHVSEYRNMDLQAVKDTEARVFKAEKALELGLIDSIMEEDEFWEHLGVSGIKDKKTESETSAVELSNTIKGEINMSMDKELQDKLAEMQAALEAQNKQLEAYKAKEAEAKKAELETTMSGFSFVADMKDQLVSFMLSEVGSEQKQMLVDVLGKADAALAETVEKHTSEMSEMQEKLEAAETAKVEAEAKVEKTIAEFGQTQSSVEVEVEESLTASKPQELTAAERTKQLAAYVASQAK